jgi:hypothetical protein
VLKAGGFDQKYPSVGDYEGWQRVSSIFGICLQNEELVYERIHELQDSNGTIKINTSYLHLNSILEDLSRQVDPSLLQVLRRHWTVHFLSPRFSRFVRQMGMGKFQLAMSLWKNAPLGISPVSCIAAYPVFKFNKGHVTTARLLANITKLNYE